MSPESALQELVRGSGTRYRFTSPLTAALVLDSEVDRQPWLRYATGAIRVRSAVFRWFRKTGPRSRDRPASVEMISHDITEQRGETTLREAIRNVSGLSKGGPSLSFNTNFYATGPMGQDGLDYRVDGFAEHADAFRNLTSNDLELRPERHVDRRPASRRDHGRRASHRSDAGGVRGLIYLGGTPIDVFHHRVRRAGAGGRSAVGVPRGGHLPVRRGSARFPYSFRSATTGSTRVARRAGT